MYRITKRISDGSTIIGYVLTDGNQEAQMDKPSVINLAKQGLIMNVKVSGDTISGTNGFELKSLPTINMKQLQQKNSFQTHEKLAAVVRHLDTLGVPSLETLEQRRQITDTGNQILQQELASGKLNKDMLHVNSGNLQIIRKFACEALPSLIRYLKNFDNIPVPMREKIFKQVVENVQLRATTVDKLEDEVLTLVINSILDILKDELKYSIPTYVGYLVKVSPDLRSTLTYQKLKYGTGEVIGEGRLEADSVALLTRAELVLLSSRVTMSGAVDDFKLRFTSRKISPKTKWEFMQSCQLSCETSAQDVGCSDVVDLKQILEPEVLSRFIPEKVVRELIDEITIKFFANKLISEFAGNNFMRKVVQLINTMPSVYDGVTDETSKRHTHVNIRAIDGSSRLNRQQATKKSSDNKKGLLGMFKR